MHRVPVRARGDGEHFPQEVGVAAERAIACVGGCCAVPWVVPGNHAEEDDAECPDVALGGVTG